MPEIVFSGWLAEPNVLTTLFTWFVLGAVCFGLSVLPQWQAQEMARARKEKEEEAARVVKLIPREALRKAA